MKKKKKRGIKLTYLMCLLPMYGFLMTNQEENSNFSVQFNKPKFEIIIIIDYLWSNIIGRFWIVFNDGVQIM